MNNRRCAYCGNKTLYRNKDGLCAQCEVEHRTVKNDDEEKESKKCLELGAKTAVEQYGKIPTEEEEQKALFRWLAYAAGSVHNGLKWCVHIVNEGKRSVRNGAALKAMGLRKGFPDIFVPIATKEYHGLFIELKRTKGGRVSAEQQEWIDYLNSAGYFAKVCYGWFDAATTICEYLHVKLKMW
ncbi:MAG: VRR-NUC domain-containing protein [Faecalibacterium sp.]|nr:VRR-NUC domain-containing protein [Ruminococcus sp.]MCM1392091.1 VRR-NUC domain-containing protein [Ruminococcus sp.]MCM1485788.1 VRR-NUC domain-containing protein [Faecalibacterium sp.]